MHRIPPPALLAAGAVAFLGFGYTASLVARRQTERYDDDAREQVQAVRGPATEAAAEASGPIGKEFLHFPVALVVTAALWRHGLGARAVVPVLASAVSEITNRLVTRTLHIRVVPPGHPEHSKQKPSFPSGHAMETTAVAVACAYVLAREEMVRPATAFGTAGLLSATSAVGRLVLDRHWVSDAVGGWLLGLSIAAASAAAYERIPA